MSPLSSLAEVFGKTCEYDHTNSSVSRDDQIAQLLTPYELQEYRLRSSPAVRSLLNSTYVAAPAASLKEVVARYCSESGFKGDVDQSKMEEIVRSVLGDQAAQVFELSHNSRDYRTIYGLTRQTQSDPFIAISIYNLQQETKKLLESQPGSASTVISEARRQVARQIGTEETEILFDRLHFPNL